MDNAGVSDHVFKDTIRSVASSHGGKQFWLHMRKNFVQANTVGSALWRSRLTVTWDTSSHNAIQVPISDSPLLIQLPLNVPGKAGDDGHPYETWRESLAPNLSLSYSVWLLYFQINK